MYVYVDLLKSSKITLLSIETFYMKRAGAGNDKVQSMIDKSYN